MSFVDPRGMESGRSFLVLFGAYLERDKTHGGVKAILNFGSGSNLGLRRFRQRGKSPVKVGEYDSRHSGTVGVWQWLGVELHKATQGLFLVWIY